MSTGTVIVNRTSDIYMVELRSDDHCEKLLQGGTKPSDIPPFIIV